MERKNNVGQFSDVEKEVNDMKCLLLDIEISIGDVCPSTG